MKDKKAIVRSKLINGLARARNKEKFWVPDINQTHHHPNTVRGEALSTELRELM